MPQKIKMEELRAAASSMALQYMVALTASPRI
jgi:hypothetical protein